MDYGGSCNTVNSAVYSIKWARRLNNLTDPIDNSFVMSLQEAGGRIACPKKSKKGPVTIDMLIDFCTKFKDCKHLFVIRDVTMISLKVQKLLQNSMLWRSTCFYIVTVVHWNIVFIESCMYKFVLGKINKLQKKWFRYA